jgi:hypothetical protein
MNLGKLFDFLNFVSTKENSGGTYTPDLFNLNLPIVIQDIWNDEYKKWQTDQTSTDVMSFYETFMGGDNSPLTVDSSGYAKYPADYVHYTSMVYKYEKSTGTEYKTVDVLNTQAFDARKDSWLQKADKDNPIATFSKDFIEFLPKDLQFIEFKYLNKPETPVYDYYIDSSLNNIYLAPNTSHTLTTGEEGSKGQLPAVLPAVTIVDSLSVEMTMPEFMHTIVALKMLSLIGINLRDVDLVNYAEIYQKKSEQK